MGMQAGLCFYLRESNARDIRWINLVPNMFGGYWYKTPKRCSTKQGAIDCLQYRVYRMKKNS